MSATTERKTLSIKGKPGMWSAPSKKEVIEQQIKDKLKKITKDTLGKHIKKFPQSPTYNEKYRWNALVMDDLSSDISLAYKDLILCLRFKTQADNIFEIIAKDVNLFLIEEVGEEFAKKFIDAYEHFAHPKQGLQKVFLSSPEGGGPRL